MTTFVFTNNLKTTLSASITASQTTISIASASGFPTLTAGQTLALTLVDAATYSKFEVVYCTAISTTTLTVARGQEGTTAQAYNTGDYIFDAVTAGMLQTFIQNFATTAQSQAGTATDVAVNPAGLAAYALPLHGTADNSNALGGTAAASWALQSWVNANFLGLHGTADNSTQLQGYSASHFTTYGDFTTSHTANGYQLFANGLILQWGEASGGSTGTGTTSFPTAFGANPLSIMMTQQYNGVIDKYAPTVESWNTSSFTWRLGANYASGTNFFWIAVGY